MLGTTKWTKHDDLWIPRCPGPGRQITYAAPPRSGRAKTVNHGRWSDRQSMQKRQSVSTAEEWGRDPFWSVHSQLNGHSMITDCAMPSRLSLLHRLTLRRRRPVLSTMQFQFRHVSIIYPRCPSTGPLLPHTRALDWSQTANYSSLLVCFFLRNERKRASEHVLNHGAIIIIIAYYSSIGWTPRSAKRLYLNNTTALTPSTPAVPNCCCSQGLAPYWSNPPFLIFDIRALWRSVLSARAPECQKLKMVG